MTKLLALLLVLGIANAEIPGVWLKNSTFTFVPKIILGEDAREGEFPYQISLQVTDRSHHMCGGSILTSHWALTAAHCCDVNKTFVHILVGTHLLNQGGTRHQIDRIIVHPEYKPSQYWKNDICLIRVTTPFQFSEKVKKVTLPTEGWEIKSGELLNISGWGYTKPDGQQVIPNRLQKGVNYTALSNDECGNITNIPMSPSYLCALASRIGQGVCNGDSGGPLVQNGVQLGIASWIFRPCGHPYPDFYCRVPQFSSWISSTLGNESSEIIWIANRSSTIWSSSAYVIATLFLTFYTKNMVLS